MEDSSNLPKVEIKADLTGVLNKAYDDTFSPATSTLRNGLGFCSNFLTAQVKPYMYRKIKEAEYRIKEIDKKLEQKYNDIPIEYQAEPRTNILGPVIDVLKYNLEEEHIREMFTNILCSEIDSRTQSCILPSYIEIVKQLSKEDAEFLKDIIDSHSVSSLPLWVLIAENKDSHFNILAKIIRECNNDYVILNSIVLDNLLRLRILEISLNTLNTDTDYNACFNYLKETDKIKAIPIPPNFTLSYQKRSIIIYKLRKAIYKYLFILKET